MYSRATNAATQHPLFTGRPKRERRGTALVSAMVVMVGLTGLLYAAVGVSAVEVKQSRHAIEDVRAEYLASAGIERGLHFVRQAALASSAHDPLAGLNNLFGGGVTLSPFVDETINDGAGNVGSYTVTMSRVEQTATSVSVRIQATGYLPEGPSALAPGERVLAWRALETTVRYNLAPSKVFDYSYFLNNWGWFYGNTINSRGNARSNGQFDAAGYSPTVTGQPTYDTVAWNGSAATLTGYHDDNLDGLKNGADGGIFAGWDIVGTQHVQGNGGQAQNQHEFEGTIPMPNLSDLSGYEANAIAQNSSITINGVQMADGVYGDEPAERQNLYLVGTLTNPIVLNGPIVVRGDVIISGYVTGKGAIYSGGNVYCPNSVRYVNAPTTTRPASNTQAATEAWLSANWNKDFLGLFARENVVVGDHTNSTWRSNVSWWMNSALNSSAEDAGEDLMPHTKVGRDGISNTADDDVLEGDHVFTIDHYTAEDEALGLVPPGYQVGDAIPGSGEDIDGDGQYDDATTLADVTLTKPMNHGHFGGNLPHGGVHNYSSISSLYATHLDAVIYTNHSFCWLVLGGTAANINGALVSRNENIIYGTPSVNFNYDVRLLGGSSSQAASLLPRVLEEAEILRWVELDRDPNHDVVAP